MKQIRRDKPDWVIEAEAKLRTFGVKRRTFATVHQHTLMSFRALRHLNREAEAG